MRSPVFCPFLFFRCFGPPTLSSAPSPLKEGRGMAENRWEFFFFTVFNCLFCVGNCMVGERKREADSRSVLSAGRV